MYCHALLHECIFQVLLHISIYAWVKLTLVSSNNGVSLDTILHRAESLKNDIGDDFFGHAESGAFVSFLPLLSHVSILACIDPFHKTHVAIY